VKGRRYALEVLIQFSEATISANDERVGALRLIGLWGLLGKFTLPRFSSVLLPRGPLKIRLLTLLPGGGPGIVPTRRNELTPRRRRPLPS
jgi:hypothetical protein